MENKECQLVEILNLRNIKTIFDIFQLETSNNPQILLLFRQFPHKLNQNQSRILLKNVLGTLNYELIPYWMDEKYGMTKEWN